MEGTVVQEHDLELRGPLFGEVVQEDLEGGGAAVWQLQLEVVPGDGRECPEKPSGLEDLLKGADRFDPFGGNPLACTCEEAEAALIPAVQVHAGAAGGGQGDQFRTALLEVFLKAATASGSFFTCDLRATLHWAP